MIAPNSLAACCTSLLKHARAKPKHPRFHSDIMSNFLLNGDYIYLLLAATALVFDATLTFCVFADAPSRYGKFSTPSAFVERACAYTVACALPLYCARCLRIRMEKAKASHALVIRTSPYSESHLPM
jgi:hypothetical protein